jgi:hypothetical protein
MTRIVQLRKDTWQQLRISGNVPKGRVLWGFGYRKCKAVEVRRGLASGEPEMRNPERISSRCQVGVSGFDNSRSSKGKDLEVFQWLKL